MAAKQEKQASVKPIAVTYAGARVDGVWRVWRFDVHLGDDGRPRVASTEVVVHPERLVVRERMVTLLMSREVLP